MKSLQLSSRVWEEFEERDWQHGHQYFDRGAVDILQVEHTSLDAEVRGSSRSPYNVWLDWSNAHRGILVVDCSCPRFADIGLCKHVAATILAADARGIGEKVPGKRNLLIEPSEDWDDFDSDGDDADEEVWEGPDRSDGFSSGSKFARTAERRKFTKEPAPPVWKKQLSILAGMRQAATAHASNGPVYASKKPRQFCFLLDLNRSRTRGWPCVSLRQRPLKKNGTFGKMKPVQLSREEANELASEEDRRLIGLLAGNESSLGSSYYYLSQDSYRSISDFAIAPPMWEVLLPRLCASGRFGWLPEAGSPSGDDIRPLAWDDGPAWKLKLDVAKSGDKRQWLLQGKLVREAAVEDLGRPLMVLPAGLAIFPDCIARFDPTGTFEWAKALRETGPMSVPVKQQEEFVEMLAQLPSLPAVELPDELKWEEDRPAPLPRLTISKSKGQWETELECRLTIEYGEHSAPWNDGSAAWYDRSTRRAVRRDPAAEGAAFEQLQAAGARLRNYGAPNLFFLKPAKMPELVARLAAAGWKVEAEGHVVRSAGKLSLSVTSGVDWFDLEGTCDFGDVSASLPTLLAALHKGEKFIQFDDGSQGMLPEEWLARFANLVDFGHAEGDRVRFLPTQAMLLDALLAAQESRQVAVDETFARVRDKLHTFEGIKPSTEPKTFIGKLRDYQREGLGWLHFLDDFAFGGCLADDMGLGKTIQVLAMLDERRQRRANGEAATNGSATDGGAATADAATDAATAPSLAVVPRSLVFNWIEEAKRFAPQLRVLSYSGAERHSAIDQLNDHDLVVTTYGTLRRDIAKLSSLQFDYAILDEAQAIKNASSQSAKACRLLQSRRRLAMTGTPVENHLGELWSLFEFLNPGMLGRNQQLHQRFSSIRRATGADGKHEQDRQPGADLTLLSQALRPFMLRRTKQQVLSELPEKTEQTLYCELDSTERTMYDELREHYRRSLLERVQKVGVNRSKIHVLEALLRLRQAACHPGLLDKKQAGGGSAKLDTLLEQLSEIIAEGHKALVFSQFTSLLAIVRRHLDSRKIVYEYLDGKTTKRQERVERFQTDPDCPLFLISLKAGGHGLNLTAADYVFILDPWWNPAVEAQAVDRAHRIGQNRNVFAYRLIARDTVEEKILQLQEKKRDLADAIISADNSPLRNLTAEDLQLLLG